MTLVSLPLLWQSAAVSVQLFAPSQVCAGDLKRETPTEALQVE